MLISPCGLEVIIINYIYLCQNDLEAYKSNPQCVLTDLLHIHFTIYSNLLYTLAALIIKSLLKIFCDSLIPAFPYFT